MSSEDVISEITPIIEDHFERNEDFIPGKSTIRLSRPTFEAPEVLEAIESLISTQVTMGTKVESFETEWADYIGASRAHMVNSGSSANLLALKSLEGDTIEPGDEVIVPAVAWSTSLFPILDVGATPVLVDVERDSYTIDVDAFRSAITEKTSAVVLVHLLGNPCDMEPILEICDNHDISIIEDSCEAHGAEYNGKPVGTFGELGTFSFFFSHHISTIEGGMVVTDDNKLSERIRMSRAHGWVRDLDDPTEHAETYPDIDRRFLFKSTGYNLRPTEIQGAFGSHQLLKLDDFVEKRRSNGAYLNDKLSAHDEYFRLFSEREGTRCSWFAYPFQLKESAPFTISEFQKYLEKHNIETRPILAGNLARQPALNNIDYRIDGKLQNSEHIHENGLFIGNHHRLTEEKLNYIVNTVNKFIQTNT
jgi:CDP-6-deoxy-D-xylo-4-hexulose-3-dehydrase